MTTKETTMRERFEWNFGEMLFLLKKHDYAHDFRGSLLSFIDSECERARGEVWQEAETAPKTGEHILVNLGKGQFGVCGGKLQDGYAVVHYWPHKGEEGFYLSLGNDGDNIIRFTHWMPLPSLTHTKL